MILFLTLLMTISSVIPHPHHWDHHHDHHELQVHLLGDPLDLLGDRHNETICRQPHRLYTHTGLLRFLRIRFFRGNPTYLYTFLPLASFAEHKYKNSTCEKVFAINRRADCANKRSAPLFPNSGLHYRRTWCNNRNFGVEIEFLQLPGGGGSGVWRPRFLLK